MSEINKCKMNENKMNKSKITDKSHNTNNSHNTDNSYNTTTITNNYYSSKDIQSEPVDPILNSANRTKLRQMVGKQIRVWGYAIAPYNGIHEPGGIKFTIINIHDSYNYISDHIQLTIPLDIYDNLDIERNLLMIKGIVYEYNTSGVLKQSIVANDIKISYANEIKINSDLIYDIYDVDQTDMENMLNKIASYSPDDKFKLLMNSIYKLNNIILGLPKNFISNYIINQYTINYDPESINRADFNLLRNNQRALIDITFLILSVIKKIMMSSFNNLYMIFTYINWILNSMQGFEENDSMKDMPLKLKRFPKEFAEFCKDNNLKSKSAYRYIKTRNLDFDGKVMNKEYAYIDALQLLCIEDKCRLNDENNKYNKLFE